MDPITGLPETVFSPPPDSLDRAAPSDELGRDTFLTLLTTQLQNQDPSAPMANEEFIAQLAQFTGVEQMMGMRDILETTAMGIAALNNASMANLLGTRVTAASDTFHYDGRGEVPLRYAAATDATDVTVDIFDADGRFVRRIEVGTLSAGEGSIPWDGRDAQGRRVPEGTYRFAFSAEGIEERIVGIVDEMDYTGGTPRPSVGGVPVDIGAILTLQAGT